jgi:hypothetical protein
MSESNTKLNQIQDIKITKAVMKDLGEGDKININYSPTMIVQNNNAHEVPLTDIEVMMWTILETLEEPKLDNLRYLAIDTILKKFSPYAGPVKKTAEYLDMQRTYISRLKADSAKRKELNAPEIIDQELPKP